MFSTMPSTGIFIIRAMFTAFSTIMPTSSCGLVTTTMPSSGMDWNTVSGTSPVPGGMSMNIMSSWLHITSCQNCLTTPAITGPRQTTGAVTSSSSRFMLITSMPVAVFMGSTASSVLSAIPLKPNTLGIDGPVTSASSTAVSSPARRAVTASRLVTSDLPTPPLPLTMPMVLFTLLFGFSFSIKSAGFWLRLGQFSPQEEQSWVQFSLMMHLRFLFWGIWLPVSANIIRQIVKIVKAARKY